MFCTNCGKQIDDDSVYCIYCGHNVLIVEEEKIEKKEEKVEEQDVIKNINLPKLSMMICISLLIIISVASIINIIKFYMLGRDTDHILGQMVFVLVFILSIILLWKSKKIGGAILISFILFKMISSIYYYIETSGYFINSLIIDEIFYLTIISLLVVSWKILK